MSYGWGDESCSSPVGVCVEGRIVESSAYQVMIGGVRQHAESRRVWLVMSVSRQPGSDASVGGIPCVSVCVRTVVRKGAKFGVYQLVEIGKEFGVRMKMEPREAHVVHLALNSMQKNTLDTV